MFPRKITNLMMVFFGLLFFSFLGCSSEEEDTCDVSFCKNTVPTTEDDILKSYIESKSWQMDKNCDGAYYFIEEPGFGTHPDRCSDVTVSYTGKLLNGVVFDASDEPFSTNIRETIEGWRNALPLLGEGGKMTLLLPPSLGYGASSNAGIPGNSSLIFEIELFEVLN